MKGDGVVLVDSPTERTLRRGFASVLRELRQKSGLTQREVAARRGVDKSAVCHLEQGKSGSISIENLLAYADILGIEPVDLLLRVLDRCAEDLDTSVEGADGQ